MLCSLYVRDASLHTFVSLMKNPWFHHSDGVLEPQWHKATASNMMLRDLGIKQPFSSSTQYTHVQNVGKKKIDGPRGKINACTVRVISLCLQSQTDICMHSRPPHNLGAICKLVIKWDCVGSYKFANSC